MAKYSLATSDALTKEAWDEKLFRDAVKESYFSRFMGEGPTNVVQVKTELEKQKGDKITFGLRMRLSGAGVTSGTTLEGNEESLTTHSDSVTLEQYRHAVRDDGKMTDQRVEWSVTEEMRMAIKDWGAEKIDSLIFTELFTSQTRFFYITSAGAFTITGTEATAKSGLDAGDPITPNFISFIKTAAKTGRHRNQVPIRPVKVDGREYYILLVHPDVMYDLKTNPTWQQAMREAQDRGPSNPLFRGATAIWDGVVVHEHENCTIATDGGGGSDAWAKCAFLGAQALGWAWGQRPETVQETFDYGNETGIAWSMIGKARKFQFNSEDYGSFAVYLPRTNIE